MKVERTRDEKGREVLTVADGWDGNLACYLCGRETRQVTICNASADNEMGVCAACLSLVPERVLRTAVYTERAIR